MDNELEWRCCLCEANKKMMTSSREEIQRIVNEYPMGNKIMDALFGGCGYRAAEYDMATRFVKKHSDAYFVRD